MLMDLVTLYFEDVHLATLAKYTSYLSNRNHATMSVDAVIYRFGAFCFYLSRLTHIAENPCWSTVLIFLRKESE